jgi:hypothetical protein
MSRYENRIWKALAIQGAGALAAIALILVLVRLAPQLPLAVVLSGLSLAGVLVVAAGQPWWRRIDEMEREMHALAWYEGSVPGAALALLWMLGLTAHSGGLTAHSGAYREMAFGGALCFMAQGLAYLVFWAIRAMNRRSRAAA